MAVRLSERYAPKDWADIVGQPDAVAMLSRFERDGRLSGRAYFFAAKYGQGKTTMAEIIASKVAEPWATYGPMDGSQVTAAILDDMEGFKARPPLGRGVCYIIDECHALRGGQLTRLLTICQRMPHWLTVCFTTSAAGEAALFDKHDDAKPLASRCEIVPMAKRDLAEAFARKAQDVARAEGLDGKPLKDYIRLAKECRNDLREMYSRIEAGVMVAGGAE